MDEPGVDEKTNPISITFIKYPSGRVLFRAVYDIGKAVRRKAIRRVRKQAIGLGIFSISATGIPSRLDASTFSVGMVEESRFRLLEYEHPYEANKLSIEETGRKLSDTGRISVMIKGGVVVLGTIHPVFSSTQDEHSRYLTIIKDRGDKDKILGSPGSHRALVKIPREQIISVSYEVNESRLDNSLKMTLEDTAKKRKAVASAHGDRLYAEADVSSIRFALKGNVTLREKPLSNPGRAGTWESCKDLSSHTYDPTERKPGGEWPLLDCTIEGFLEYENNLERSFSSSDIILANRDIPYEYDTDQSGARSSQRATLSYSRGMQSEESMSRSTESSSPFMSGSETSETTGSFSVKGVAIDQGEHSISLGAPFLAHAIVVDHFNAAAPPNDMLHRSVIVFGMKGRETLPPNMKFAIYMNLEDSPGDLVRISEKYLRHALIPHATKELVTLQGTFFRAQASCSSTLRMKGTVSTEYDEVTKVTTTMMTGIVTNISTKSAVNSAVMFVDIGMEEKLTNCELPPKVAHAIQLKGSTAHPLNFAAERGYGGYYNRNDKTVRNIFVFKDIAPRGTVEYNFTKKSRH